MCTYEASLSMIYAVLYAVPPQDNAGLWPGRGKTENVHPLSLLSHSPEVPGGPP